MRHTSYISLILKRQYTTHQKCVINRIIQVLTCRKRVWAAREHSGFCSSSSSEPIKGVGRSPAFTHDGQLGPTVCAWPLCLPPAGEGKQHGLVIKPVIHMLWWSVSFVIVFWARKGLMMGVIERQFGSRLVQEMFIFWNNYQKSKLGS